MHDAGVVRGLERGGDLRGDRQGLADGNRPARQPLGQVLAVDELHDQRRRALDSSSPYTCAMFG